MVSHKIIFSKTYGGDVVFEFFSGVLNITIKKKNDKKKRLMKRIKIKEKLFTSIYPLQNP